MLVKKTLLKMFLTICNFFLCHSRSFYADIAHPTASDCLYEGSFRYKNDCSRFYRCVDWSHEGNFFSIFHFVCPTGTVFDEELQVCNFPWRAKPCVNEDMMMRPKPPLISGEDMMGIEIRPPVPHPPGMVPVGSLPESQLPILPPYPGLGQGSGPIIGYPPGVIGGLPGGGPVDVSHEGPIFPTEPQIGVGGQVGLPGQVYPPGFIESNPGSGMHEESGLGSGSSQGEIGSTTLPGQGEVTMGESGSGAISGSQISNPGTGINSPGDSVQGSDDSKEEIPFGSSGEDSSTAVPPGDSALQGSQQNEGNEITDTMETSESTGDSQVGIGPEIDDQGSNGLDQVHTGDVDTTQNGADHHQTVTGSGVGTPENESQSSLSGTTQVEGKPGQFSGTEVPNEGSSSSSGQPGTGSGINGQGSGGTVEHPVGDMANATNATSGGFVLMDGSIYNCPYPGFFPHSSNCHEFYVCLEILPGVLFAEQLYRCPDRYLFDDETRRCQKEAKVNCTKFTLEPVSSLAKENVLVVLEPFLDAFFNTPLYYSANVTSLKKY